MTVGACVEDEVVGPHLVRCLGRIRSGTACGKTSSSALLGHLEPSTLPQSVGPPRAHRKPITLQQHSDATVAPPRIACGQLGHSRQHLFVFGHQLRPLAHAEAFRNFRDRAITALKNEAHSLSLEVVGVAPAFFRFLSSSSRDSFQGKDSLLVGCPPNQGQVKDLAIADVGADEPNGLDYSFAMLRRRHTLLAAAVLCACRTTQSSSPVPVPTTKAKATPLATSNPSLVAAEVAWLNDTLIPLTSLDTIAAELASHRVVALGEATHGTREFFQVKHQLFQVLVETHGFRSLAMEMHGPRGEAIDRYIKTGDGDAIELVRNTYFFMESEEMLTLIEWMRAHNEQAPADAQLSFYGFDTRDTKAADVIANECADRHGCRTVMRDGFMSQRVLDRLGQSSGSMLVWGHNGHIAHFASNDGWKPMGHFLEEDLGEDYVAVALTFSEGGFVAPAGGALDVRRATTLTSGREVAEYVLPPAPDSALGYWFAQAREDRYFVSLAAPPLAVAGLLDKNRNLQTYGAMPPKKERTYETYAPLHESFDAVIFVRTTNGFTFLE